MHLYKRAFKYMRFLAEHFLSRNTSLYFFLPQDKSGSKRCVGKGLKFLTYTMSKCFSDSPARIFTVKSLECNTAWLTSCPLKSVYSSQTFTAEFRTINYLTSSKGMRVKNNVGKVCCDFAHQGQNWRCRVFPALLNQRSSLKIQDLLPPTILCQFLSLSPSKGRWLLTTSV